MNNELTRQYELPKSLSSIIKQSNNFEIDIIPDSQELINIKSDLQVLLPETENRNKELLKSMNYIKENVNIIDSGENVNIKQESEETLDLYNNITSRQAALETIRRRRRREETENSDDTSQHLIKLKKLNGGTSRSVSPPRPDGVKKIKKSSSKQSKQKAQPIVEDVDFVRVKPKDQVPITTFWSALEPYFRNLTEEDREFLLKKSDQSTPYLIPPLGRHYMEKWAEEEQAASIDISGRDESQKLRYFANPQDISDSQLLQNNIGSGTLTERLISSLVMEGILSDEEPNLQQTDHDEEDDLITDEIEKKYHARTILQSDPTEEIVGFEERLRRELRYAGLFGEDDIEWDAKEDDEICAELRKLAREFKEQVHINEQRKKRLLEVADCQLQYEQYRQVLDTLDSQVEQGYLKRFRPQKSKKRKTAGPKATLSENTVYAMDKRNTWINALGHIFKDKNMNMPQTSIYDENST